MKDLEDLPEWICKHCGRPLDDHQQRTPNGNWRNEPLCVEKGIIKQGIRLAS